MNEVTIPKDEAQVIALVQDTTELAARARAVVVRTPKDYEAAGAFLTTAVRTMEERIRAWFKPRKDLAHKLHKLECDDEAEQLAPVLEAKKLIGDRMLAWKRHEEQRARELEEKRNREARERQAAEVRERALNQKCPGCGHARAEHYVRDGGQLPDGACGLDGCVCKRFGAAPPPLPPPPPPAIVEPRVPKAEGVSVRTTWKHRIIDPLQLPRAFLMPDERKIGDLARSMGKTAETLCPGIEVYEEETMASRARGPR